MANRWEILCDVKICQEGNFLTFLSDAIGNSDSAPSRKSRTKLSHSHVIATTILHTIHHHRHLPGHRKFYHKNVDHV